MTDPLSAMAHWAGDKPFFFAHLLAAYQAAEAADDAALAANLGCRLEDLPMIRLCRAPREDGPGLRADVAVLCERYGLDPGRIAAVIKRGRVALRWRTPGGLRLMAARDREEET